MDKTPLLLNYKLCSSGSEASAEYDPDDYENSVLKQMCLYHSDDRSDYRAYGDLLCVKYALMNSHEEAVRIWFPLYKLLEVYSNYIEFSLYLKDGRILTKSKSFINRVNRALEAYERQQEHEFDLKFPIKGNFTVTRQKLKPAQGLWDWLKPVRTNNGKLKWEMEHC